MAMQITREQLERLAQEAQRKAQSARTALTRAQEKTEQVVGTLVRSGEVTGTSFLFGVVNGRTGGLEIVGVPVDVATGAALHVLGFMGGAGKYDDHIHAIADGALASYTNTLGFGIGARMRREAQARAGGGGGGGGGGATPQTGGGAASGGAIGEMTGAADRAMANALAAMQRAA